MGPLVVNIIVNYCCTRICCKQKMLKETEAEETIVFFVTFLTLVAFQLLGGGSLGYPRLRLWVMNFY